MWKILQIPKKISSFTHLNASLPYEWMGTELRCTLNDSEINLFFHTKYLNRDPDVSHSKESGLIQQAPR